ncbi:RraA family protein [Actinophytocola gossypii]|uniref:Putative 4-hydroxy-4-methyl-2-oxoglutarate aldolase n=1 Tax=Actinophytocola gossypii TaxID=2812003 RepID=A0ABT2J1W0_9PSEU|nr:RraA family protein [Actinophytocola gossypii]MCT2581841.1 RraA family protein [Actinophytocola gossypii]
MLSARITTELLELGASTVYEGSGLDCWVDPGLRPVWRGARLAGPAFTVRAAPGDNLAVQLGVRAAPAGSVLVVDGAGERVGYWGEILTEIAVQRGLAGLVIDGTVRDVDEIERTGFPVFSRGVAMRHAAKRDRGELGGVLDLAGRRVRPGDVVVADTDGVAVVPHEQLDAVLAGARTRAEKERTRIATIRSGVIPETTAEEGY